MVLAIAAAASAIVLSPAQIVLPLPPLPPLPPPPICLEPPLPPLCDVEPPPPGDEPPHMGELEARRDGTYLVLTWARAWDDRGIWGYRVYRDGILRARRPATLLRVRVALPCGRHRYRVEAVDIVLQTSSRSVRIVRRCS